MTLSQGRAETVMEYLRGKGIDESRQLQRDMVKP